MHQVVTTGVERTSFVFFYYPGFDATLPPKAERTSLSVAGKLLLDLLPAAAEALALCFRRRETNRASTIFPPCRSVCIC